MSSVSPVTNRENKLTEIVNQKLEPDPFFLLMFPINIMWIHNNAQKATQLFPPINQAIFPGHFLKIIFFYTTFFLFLVTIYFFQQCSLNLYNLIFSEQLLFWSPCPTCNVMKFGLHRVLTRISMVTRVSRSSLREMTSSLVSISRFPQVGSTSVSALIMAS